jgi:hypothetical protein
MILLYVDESGDFTKQGQHFVLGAVAIPEQMLSGVSGRLDRLVSGHLSPHFSNTELHTAEIRKGQGIWRGVPRATRDGLLTDVAGYLGSVKTEGFALFGVAHEPGAVAGVDPLERCYEELLLRFTEMLIRLEPLLGRQMGIVIADEAKYERVIQAVVRRWRASGTRIKPLRRLAEVPLFVDSKASRLIQAADFVAHAVYRHYAAGQSDLLGGLLGGFDSDGGVLHGLCHLSSQHRRCPCPACISRATARRSRAAARR